MKKIRRTVAITFVIAIILSMSAVNVFAATKTQDNIDVSFVTNKDSYNENEQIKTTLKVKNNNSIVLKKVDLETELPEGYKLADKSENKKTLDSIAAGESVSFDVILEKDNSKNCSTSANPSNDSKSSADTAGSGNSNGKTNTDSSAIQTGQGLLIGGFILLVVLAGGFLFAFVYRRKHVGKRMLSVILCAGVIGSTAFLIKTPANAEEIQKKSISVSETVKVGGKDLTVSSTVKYALDSEGSEDRIDKYFKENTQEILDVFPVNESKDVMSEAEAIAFLKERGFEDLTVNYYNSMSGEMLGEKEAKADSNEKHPMYNANYITDKNEMWSLYIINGDITANPVSYNLVSKSSVQLTVSESEKTTSYANQNNKFYVTLPKTTTVDLKIVSKIDAATLNGLTVEELKK